MEFEILGPLRVNGEDIVLPAKQRILLAVLLLHANRVVPVDALIDAMWDDAPPSTARTTLQGYVKRLRQNADIRVGERVITRSPGYQITVAADELDLDRFTGLCDRARSAAADSDGAGADGQLRDALALWRGTRLRTSPQRGYTGLPCPGWPSCGGKRSSPGSRRVCGSAGMPTLSPSCGN